MGQQEGIHDISKDGKNRIELGGNDNSYKHRSPQDQQQDQDLNQKQNQYQNKQYLTPIDLNKCALYSKYGFKSQSVLKAYLLNETKTTKNYYMLIEIMEDLKVIIRQEKLYDPRNISVIWKPPWALKIFMLPK